MESNEELWEKNFEEQLENMGWPKILPSEIKKQGVIGEGSFGKVYKGIYKNNVVAIKKIKWEEKTQECYTTIANEIRVMLKAESTEIPKFYGLYKKKDTYRLVFEFISGKELKEIYPSLTEKAKLSICLEISEILEKFHQKKLIHRDLKPANIMINTSNNNVHLIDFGVSKIANHTSTFTQTQMGTVPYEAPEQFQIDLDKAGALDSNSSNIVPISTKSDIWSFGVMISEMFTGYKPYCNLYKKQWPTENQIISRWMANKPFPIPKNISEEIKPIVQRATEIIPDNRASAGEIKEMFRTLMQKKYSNPDGENNNAENNQQPQPQPQPQPPQQPPQQQQQPQPQPQPQHTVEKNAEKWKEAPKEIPKTKPQTTETELKKELPKELPKETQKEVPKEAPKEAPKELPKEIKKIVSQEANNNIITKPSPVNEPKTELIQNPQKENIKESPMENPSNTNNQKNDQNHKTESPKNVKNEDRQENIKQEDSSLDFKSLIKSQLSSLLKEQLSEVLKKESWAKIVKESVESAVKDSLKEIVKDIVKEEMKELFGQK